MVQFAFGFTVGAGIVGLFFAAYVRDYVKGR